MGGCENALNVVKEITGYHDCEQLYMLARPRLPGCANRHLLVEAEALDALREE